MDRQFVEDCISISEMRGIVHSDDEKWLLSEDPINYDQAEEEEEDEVGEALSLCDLPIDVEIRQSRAETNTTLHPKAIIDPSEDVNFCFWGDMISKESEMCAADEVFFQGQILPMGHSISFNNGVIVTGRCLSRSESMGYSSCYSAGFTSASSRNSSLNSHNSSISCGCSNSSATIKLPKNKSRNSKFPNQFQFSHPRPTPQIRYSKTNNRGNISIYPNQNSTFWSFLRVGLVTTTPEIATQNLKVRSKSHNSSKSLGSRNSTSNINSTTTKETGDKKQRQNQRKFFDKNSFFFSGCNCSSNSVVGPIPSRVPINAVTRSASAKGMPSHADQEDDIRTTKHQETGRKHSMSRHRTSEWLKQLSLESASAAPVCD